MAVACTLTEFQEVSYVNVLVGGREEGLDLAGTLAVGALSLVLHAVFDVGQRILFAPLLR